MRLFELDARPRTDGLLPLIVSDYLAAYRPRRESPRRLAALFLPRMLANPELHATAMIRASLASPRMVRGIWRALLIAKHSIDIQGGIEIGPGLRLPHPVGIVFGTGIVIGTDVTIYQHVTIGARPPVDHLRRMRTEPTYVINPSTERPSPTIEDQAIILGGSWVLGQITVGRGAVVGARSWLTHSLEPGAVHNERAD